MSWWNPSLSHDWTAGWYTPRKQRETQQRTDFQRRYVSTRGRRSTNQRQRVYRNPYRGTRPARWFWLRTHTPERYWKKLLGRQYHWGTPSYSRSRVRWGGRY